MKLNIGAGSYPLEGFENLDLPEFDMKKLPWPYKGESISMIVMGHVLEHVPRKNAMKVLREAKRVLEPGGVIHIAVPDMDLYIDAVEDNNQFILDKFPYRSLDSLLGGGDGEPRIEMRHRYLWCFGSLWYALMLVGFKDIRQVEFGKYDNPTTMGWALQVEAIA